MDLPRQKYYEVPGMFEHVYWYMFEDYESFWAHPDVC